MEYYYPGKEKEIVKESNRIKGYGIYVHIYTNVRVWKINSTNLGLKNNPVNNRVWKINSTNIGLENNPVNNRVWKINSTN